ncbi:MAG TPA: polyprenyl diphosphate synthase [Dehalococcoidia bacterium]|nr:polyprenyl diphosphate synthase [Dehalococcoidia bacterium]
MSTVDLRRFGHWGGSSGRRMETGAHTAIAPGPATTIDHACAPGLDKTPVHVAIIMDGNGRWAEGRGLRREAGHRAGTENIRRVLERLCERGVRYLTLFAFSTENWGRPKTEVRSLMRLPGLYLKREVRQLHEAGIRLRHLGHLEVLDARLQRQIRDAVALTRDNDRMTLSVAFNYGGRREIVDAVQRMIAAGTRPEEIDEDTLGTYLDTADLPDPDLIVRTGGEMRLSNFLLWQAAYAEYYCTATYWPDFDKAEVDAALDAYAARSRKFGTVPGRSSA